ncbi:ATP-dependent nuclease [Streptomyces lasalocidi]|nr:AAA family ATPase [Streptomyces lasalocidi]
MMDVEFRVRNYRCFGDEPIVFRVRDGFTALVGTNNSGKSSLLRLLYEVRPLLAQMYQSDVHSLFPFSSRHSRTFSWIPQILPGERIVRAGSERPMELQIIVHDGPDGPFVDEHGDQLVVSAYFLRQDVEFHLELRRLSGAKIEALSRKQFMSLRTAMATLHGAMYIGPFRNAIHVGGNKSYYDIQTGDSFISTFRTYKSGADPAANEAIHEMTEDLRRIFGFERLEINPADDTLQLIIDGRSHRLSEMGAGFAHFVVVMVNVLVHRPNVLLIDEPELNLHASLQLDFLQTLARYTRHGVVFATHSLGLARTAADKIYTLAKPLGGTSRVQPYEDNQDLVTLLGQLSFDSRPEMGFSKVLLVEGKTEVRALMQLLRIYGKEHEVLMVPLHGADLIRGDSQQELIDLLRIGKDVRYLIDSERTTAEEPLAAERQKFIDLCQRLEIPGSVLERRALENYFPERAVKRVFGEAAVALGPYDKLAKMPGAVWRKTENWRVAAEMRREELDGTDLGTFLQNL